MLRAMTTRILNAPAELCVECLINPTKFMKMSRYTYSAREHGGEHEVVFRWTTLGITRYYRVKLRVLRGGDRIEYISTRDSDYYFRMRFGLSSPRSGRTRVVVYAEMETDLLTSLVGKKSFKKFLEELVDNNLRSLLSEIARGDQVVKPRDVVGVECTSCVLYEHSTSTCYYLQVKVDDTEKPPCGGKAYVLLKSIVAREEV